MIRKSPPAVPRHRWRRGVRFLILTGRGTIVESLYLLTAPVIAAVGLLFMLAGLCVATIGSLVPGGSAAVAGALAPARWFADLERWRIAKVRTPGAQVSWRRERTRATVATRDPELWLEAAHAVVAVPAALVTSIVTVVWWFVGLGAATVALRNRHLTTGPLRPMTLYAGSRQSHIALSLSVASPAGRMVFGTVVGLLLLASLPLATRACIAAQAGLGQALLSDTSALHRRISGLEKERDDARAQTVAAVTAEATALRRLERDIHDGPQQRLVRLAMELGRAQHHFDGRPHLAREALADALEQTREALEELRVLSRGIAPPILADRGLREALNALAARCTIPVELDADPVGQLTDAIETAAYFVIAEALTNVAKHSRASTCTIGLRHEKQTLRVWVHDDGVGGAALDKGHGLRGLADRLLAVGGALRLVSPVGGPTTLTAELPCR